MMSSRSIVISPRQIQQVPGTPGVYVMRNSSGRVLYVGKTIHLKRRLQSYFRQSRNGTNPDEKIAELVPRVARISLKLTGSELEALLLEAQLIKQYQPPFNEKIKFFQHHVYLRVARGSRFPQVSIERNINPNDPADYYGPFSGKTSLEYMLDGFNQVFQLRTCDLATFLSHADYPCIRFEEGLCSAPCADRISSREYQKLLQEFIAYLKGAPSKRVSDFLLAHLPEAETDLEGEDEAEDRLGPDLLTKLTGFLPVNFQDTRCLIVLPHARPGVFRMLLVLSGVPRASYVFDTGKQGRRRLSNVIRQIYERLDGSSSEPVRKDQFEEAKIIDRWLHQPHPDSLVIDLNATSSAECHFRLEHYMLPACQLSLFYDSSRSRLHMAMA